MKKHLPYAPFMGLIAGAIAIVLRIWMLMAGTDDKGLSPSNHPGLLLTCLLCLAAVIFFRYLTRGLDEKRSYKENFPASLPGSLGLLLFGCALILASIQDWQADPSRMAKIMAITGAVSGLLLIPAALARKDGKGCIPCTFGICCLHFGLRVFYMGRVWGAEPEIHRFLFPFLAVLALLLATYHLWGFGVSQGKRSSQVFWGLTAVVLSMAAIPGSDRWYLFLGAAAGMATNLCDLRPLPEPPIIPEEPTEEPEENPEEAPPAGID